jgi:hypothetical protein
LTHGRFPRALHPENFRGAVDAIVEIIETVSGVGTVSYSKCSYGYDANFNGLVRALEDLNTSISGIQGGGAGGSGIVSGSGIYITQSGSFEVINADLLTFTAGSGVYLSSNGLDTEIGTNLVGLDGVKVTYSGEFAVISGATPTAVAVVSGIVAGDGVVVTTSGNSAVVSTRLRGEGLVDFTYDAGIGVVSGITNTVLSGTNVDVTYSGIYTVVNSTATGGGGASVTVSGSPGVDYTTGDLWFDTNEGRLFVYASGNGVSDPAWYQTNAEAFALKAETAPSGTGLNAPPRDGSIWFNTLMGSLFVYDATSSGWYEAGPSRSFAYSPTEPAASTEGAGWYSTTDNVLKVWNGSSWISV